MILASEMKVKSTDLCLGRLFLFLMKGPEKGFVMGDYGV